MKSSQFKIRNGLTNPPKAKLKPLTNADLDESGHHEDFQPLPSLPNESGLSRPGNSDDLANVFKSILGSLEQVSRVLRSKRQDLQVRDRSYLLQIPSGSSFAKRRETLKKWLEKMISDVVSIAFNYYSNDQLSYEQTKIFCSENILSNMAALVSSYRLTPAELREADEFIRDDVLELLLKKYPMTQSIVVNRALEAIAKAPDLSEKLENDFFSINNIAFALKPDYSKEIKLVINAIINRTNASNALMSDSSNFEAFRKLMGKVFEQVQDNDWMQANEADRSALLEPFFHLAQGNEPPFSKAKDNLDNDGQKREYREKVKQYTSYLIGRKVNENVSPFSEEEVEAKGIEIKSTAILRILTKWCEQLWQKFIPKNYYANKTEDFRLLSGEIKSLSPEMKSNLDRLMQAEKAQIRAFMAKLTKDNYEAQINLLNQLLEGCEDEFREKDLEKVSEKFSVLIGKSLEKWVVKYLNRLIQGLANVSHQFFAKYFSKDWPSPPNLVSFKIGDLLRCKCSSGQREILYIFKQIKWVSDNRPEVLSITRIKNRLSSGTNDILMNVRFCGSIISEIQLAVNSNKSKFLKSSNGMSHYLYEIQRSLFGPINELGSIWRNLDLRASYFDKSVSAGKSAGSHRCETLRKAFEMEVFEGPFICSTCSSTYSSSEMIIKHVKCSECSHWSCAHCQIKEMSASKLAGMFVADLELRKVCEKKVEIDEDSKELPVYGVAVSLNSQKQSEVIVFKRLEVRGMSYLFTKQAGKIKLLLKIAQEGAEQRFLKENIVFELSNENGSNMIDITDTQANQDYFLPRHVADCYRNHKTSITLENEPLNSSNCAAVFNGSEKDRLAVSSLTLSNTHIKSVSPLEELFSNLQELTLNQNSSLENLDGLPLFLKLKILTMREADSLSAMPKAICSLLTLTKLDLKDCLFSQIPGFIGELRQLRSLDISHSEARTWKKFVRSIPSQLYSLTQLEELNLSYQLILELSEDIGKLKNLRILNLRRNGIPTIPATINLLTRLEFFDFRENPIRELPQSLAGLHKLNEFRLQKMGEDILTLFGEKMYRNYFSSLPADLQEIEHLTVLNVHSENLRALPCLEKCKNLEEIDLFRCALLEQPRLKNCLSLKRLSLKQQMNRNEEEQFVAISPHLFKEAPNLLYFCASFNFIKSLPESLKCLTQLVELDLHHNAIEELGEEIGSCKALVTLNLWSNKLKKLPSSLRNLQKLQILAVNENELEELNESVTECAGLHELLLNNNRIKALPEGISRLVNLEVLDFEENLVEVVPQSLSSLKKIKEKRLRFSDNPIYLVECPAAVDRFGDPNSKSIKNSLETGSFKLGPRRNKLSCISKSIQKAVNLTIFQISSHELSTLPAEFSALSNLQSLTLNENAFSIFPAAVAGCASLKHLIMESNSLSSLSKQLCSMDRLQTLDLINNKLAAIDEGINGLASLKELYLDNNQLVRFTPNTFSQLANLTLFSMNGNQLEELPLGLLQCQQLEQLYIYQNKLKALPDHFPAGCKLTKVNLSNNELTAFPQGLITCSQLQILSMDKNKIANISENLHKMSSLTNLSMNENKIREIPRSIGLAQSLRGVNLPNNQIEVLVKELGQLTELANSSFNLYRNPLKKVECRQWIMEKGNEETKKIAKAIAD